MAVSPEEAAAEAARYLDLDPGFFLEQAALAGLVVCTDGSWAAEGRCGSC